MSLRAVFLHSERFTAFRAYEGYPWIFERSQATIELCRRQGLLEVKGVALRSPRRATLEELKSYHKKEYLGLLERANKGKFEESMLASGLGTLECPVYPGCFDYHRLVVGGSLLGARLLLDGEAEVVFGPTGGLHHAGPDFAAGFCYLNDVVLAIQRFLSGGWRVLYVDIDAHHGDMVQDAFYHRDDVMTVSFHENPETLFPHRSGFVQEMGEGKGKGFNINVPLLAGTGDETFLWAFVRLLPPIARAFVPDVLVAVLGADALASDSMSNLRLTTHGYVRAVGLLRTLAPRILALGCGGYVLDSMTRAWTLAWATLIEVPIRDDAELLFGGVFQGDGLPSLHDRPVFISQEEAMKSRTACEEVVRFIEEHHFPRLGIGT
jgi:acetoin utilization protein AcuC